VIIYQEFSKFTVVVLLFLYSFKNKIKNLRRQGGRCVCASMLFKILKLFKNLCNENKSVRYKV